MNKIVKIIGTSLLALVVLGGGLYVIGRLNGTVNSDGTINRPYRTYNVGDCLSFNTMARQQVHLVNCNDVATAGSVVGVFDLSSVLDANPSDNAMQLIGEARCPATTSHYFGPTNEEWVRGYRQLLCVGER